MASIGELVASLKLDSKAFTSGVKSAKSSLKDLSKSVLSGGKLIAAGVGAVVAGMTIATKATMDWADELDSLQDVTGVSNKTAAALNFTLRKSGVATETLAKGMTILNKGLVDSKGKLDITGKALKEWGINVFDANGHLKNQEQLIRDVSDRYSQFATQQEKVNFLTQVFGKSGADLIDLFDTLAADGGIDKVTKKVEAFGLSIDPNRYEQFNRNLAELKLVGLGLAVSFTERLMPVLERFLTWLNQTAQSPKFQTIRKNISDMLDSILNGGSDGQSKFEMKNVDRVAKPDYWKLVGQTIGNAIEAGARGVINKDFWHDLLTIDQEEGNKFASFMEGLTGIGRDVQPSQVIDVVKGIVKGWMDGLNQFEKDATAKVRSIVTQIGLTIQSKLDEIRGTWAGKVLTWLSTMGTALNLAPSIAAGALINLSVSIDSKLREISKAFFNRALAWTQQMIAGFRSGMGGLLSSITTMVGEINSILRGIITSFSLSIKLPSWLGGHGATSTPVNSLGGMSGGMSPDERDNQSFAGNKMPQSVMELGAKTIRALGAVVAEQTIQAMNNV